MTTFTKLKLKDVCLKISSGGTPSRKRSDYFDLNNGHLWVKSKELLEKGITDTEEKISEIGLQNSSAKYYQANTILVAMYGVNAGQLAWLERPATVNQAICALVVDDKKADWKFIYYSLLESRQGLISLARGAAQPNLNKDMVENFETSICADLKIQTRIASVLSSYDDLIENNEKRIKALEEMSQLLYTEWFVKFKFPGYEKVNMIDTGTQYGIIPENWNLTKIKKIGKVITGKTPPTSNLENFNGEVLFVKTPDIHGNIFIIETEQTLSTFGVKTQSIKLLPEKTVMVSCIGTLGVVGITSKPSQTNQQINSLILNDPEDYCFFYLFAKSLKQRLVGLGSNGATMGNVNKDKFENIEIVYPEEKTRKLFTKKTSDLFDEILLLQKNNKNLSKTRDLLIPQLVTGKRELK